MDLGRHAATVGHDDRRLLAAVDHVAGGQPEPSSPTEKAVPEPGSGLSGTWTTIEGSNGEDGPSGRPSSPGTGGGGGGASERSCRPTATITRALTAAA
jgi:hypothetical protein